MSSTVFGKNELKNVHQDWLWQSLERGRKMDTKEILMKETRCMRNHKKMRDPSNGKILLQRHTPPDASVIPASFKTRRRLPRVVIESADEGSECEAIREVYVRRPEDGFRGLVQHLLLLCWSEKEGKLHCILEQYLPKQEVLTLHDQIEILPGPKSLSKIELTEREVCGSNASETDVALTLDLSELRNKIIIAAKAEGRDFDDKWSKEEPQPAQDGPQVTPPRGTGKIPSTHTEFRTAIQNYILMLGLDTVYPKDRLAEIARKAAKNIGPALKELGLPKESTFALTKVNLFDTWFYCDDSGSMFGRRHKILRETVARLAPIATKVLENDVYVRFINYKWDGSGKFDKIEAKSIDAIIDEVGVSGGTKIGTNLAQKIVTPLIEKLKSPTGLDRPAVVTIITDGEPNCEPRDKLMETIKQCKAVLQEVGSKNGSYGHSAIVFQIHYVGSDAEEYIDELDEEIGDMLFCNKTRLDRVVAKRDGTVDSRNLELLQLAEQAVDLVLSPTTERNGCARE